MEIVKAVVKFVDSSGRIVCLTDNNIAVVVYLLYGDKTPMVDGEIVLGREFGKRRMSDWKIIE